MIEIKEMSFVNQLRQIVLLTAEKIKKDYKAEISKSLQDEYNQLEQVPPAPGDSWGQHDAMVKNGLCKKACQNAIKNRYSNLYPFDETIVKIKDGKKYINASWMKLFGKRYVSVKT